MKALSALMLALLVIGVSMTPSSAASDKQLINLFGSVERQGTGAPQQIAPKAQIDIADDDFAVTGANSQAAVSLPDSSRILIGANTKIQMKSFDQASGVPTANFIVVGGKIRFKVEHPSGAKANYTFTTSTGQIAVRGTEGDISVTDTQLQVNCYELSNPSLPIEVDLNNGKHYTLSAGQALVVGITGAVIASAAVSAVTQPLAGNFSEFNNAASNAAMGGATTSAAAAAAAGVAPAAIAAGAAAAAAIGVAVGSSHGGVTTSPTTPPTTGPTPTPPPPTPGPIVASPASLSFDAPGQTQTVTASESNYHGGFVMSGGGTVASFVKVAKNQFAVTSQGAGTTTLSIAGATGVTPASVSVKVAAGTVQVTPATLTFNKGNFSVPQSVKVSEAGYSGGFNVSGGSASVATLSGGGSGSAVTYQVSAAGGGSTSFTFKDTNGNSGSVSVTVAPGISLNPTSATLTVGGQAFNITATEAEPLAVLLSASIDKPSVATVSPSSGSASSPALFKISPVAKGSATLTVTDQYGNSQTAPITVNTPSPSPAPSTTCIPIIIHLKHGGTRFAGPDAGATPCPTPTPGPVLRHVTTPGRNVSPPVVRPIRAPETPAPHGPGKPEPHASPVQGNHPVQPGNHPLPPANHPVQPGFPGMQTPPPLPGPPG